MTVKLAHLKSGENIISDIQEVLVDERVVGYLFSKPQIVLLKDFETVSKNNEEKVKHSFDINLLPWIPFTDDEKILVPNEWVVTIVEPLKNLKSMYEKNILNTGETNDKIDFTDEQSDSSISD